ncbi:MAG: TetR/AcrR family transcriptional regulator [Solirubrobacterales bacterium]|nr:TetR/AcrR family transcriptional regulator [Solirubrobacterales bacterium]
MTNSVRGGQGARTGVVPGKRERLVEGAREVLHAQGVERTTLADIAEAADVPVGNVYYYFKTKDDLVQAVVASRIAEVRAALEALDQHRTPKSRLKAFVRMLVGQADLTARYGCPQGSLCSELDKRTDGPGIECAELMRVPIAWAEEQFRAMGRRDAHELAVALIASYQGIALLTNTLRDPEMMIREGRRLERWIDSLSAAGAGSTP